MHKDDLRRQIRQIKRQFTPQQLEELSLPIVARLRQKLIENQTIVAYYPLPDEVDVRQLLDAWIAASLHRSRQPAGRGLSYPGTYRRTDE